MISLVDVKMTGNMTKRLRKLDKKLQSNLVGAAEFAKAESDIQYNQFAERRKAEFDRKGRTTTKGRLRSSLTWIVKGNLVQFDFEPLDTMTRTGKAQHGYWMIQEAGTGNNAVAWLHTQEGEAYVFRYWPIPSQAGREIAPFLRWATPGGVYVDQGPKNLAHQIEPMDSVIQSTEDDAVIGVVDQEGNEIRWGSRGGNVLSGGIIITKEGEIKPRRFVQVPAAKAFTRLRENDSAVLGEASRKGKG